MKKFIILFMIIHIFSYANYLISNSEIVLFYDKSYNSIHYMRGDIFQGIDISRIEGKLILDGEKVISVNKYFESANLIPQTNILKLNYNIDGKYLTVNIIPSMIEKDKLYFVVEFVNFLKDNRKVDFAFRIAPQYDNKRTRENREVQAVEAQEQKSELELFEEFYELLNNEPMKEEQTEFVEKLIQDLKEVRI